LPARADALRWPDAHTGQDRVAGLSFDARTLLIVGGLLSWILAAAIEFQAVPQQGGRRLPDAWTMGLLAKGLGLNLLSQRGLVPDVWSIACANALLLAGPLFCYAALQRVRGVPTSRALVLVVPVGVGILLPIVGFGPDQFPARTLVFTGAAAFGFALNVWSAIQVARLGYVAGASLILGTSVVLAILALANAIAVAGGGVASLFAGHGVQIALYTTNAVCIAVSSFGYMDILRAQREERARSDPALQPDLLTGLYGREAFMRSGLEELHRARRRGYSISVMMIQVDRFDALAATRGHAFTDLALKRVAAAIQRDIRLYDLAGRLSDGLIGVVMPELPLAEGIAVAERIRAAVAGEDAIQNGTTRVTVSAGLCEADPEHADFESALALAAGCLHRAQLAGGDQVATPVSLPPKGFVEGTI
jgi:diguanylate cyclase (GGDEF)-like protein